MAKSFHHFADQLYCSGAEERLCALPHQAVRTHPGECLWFTSEMRAVTHADMDESKRGRWFSDKWDAVRAGAVTADALRTFDRAATSACLKRRHVLILGESTTRDLFYEFTRHAGLAVPSGACMNTGRPGAPICTRVVHGGLDNSTRITFQFLSSANATREVSITKGLLADRPPDAAFVYCFMYDWYGINPGGLWQAESDAMGQACLQLIDTAVRAASPNVPVYLLGPTYPPAWVSPYENRTRDDSAMARIFRSIHHGTGIQCVRGGGGSAGGSGSASGASGAHGGGGGGHAHGGGDYRVVSTRGMRGPLDRYNIVGHRKRDRIHPFPNAHAPVVQMMLNSIC
jgi:hypothetical protein